MARSTFDPIRLLAVLSALLLAATACNIEDSGNTYAGGDTAGGEQSDDPGAVPDNEIAISGNVYDLATQMPISGALVMTEPAIGQIRTNGQGNYVFTAATFPSLTIGTPYRITAQALGYIPNFAQVTADTRHQRNVDIPLQRAAAEFTIKVSNANLQFTDASFLGGAKTAFADINLQLEGAAAQTVSYETRVSANATAWLSIDPPTGQLTGTPKFLTVTVNKTGLAAGSYSGAINVIAEGGFAEISVTLSVGQAVEGPGDGNTDELPDDGGTDENPS
jgi:hypothetical protein